MLWGFENENDRRVMRAKAVNMAVTPAVEIVGIFQHDYSPQEFAQAARFLEEIKTELNKSLDAKIEELKERSRK